MSRVATSVAWAVAASAALAACVPTEPVSRQAAPSAASAAAQAREFIGTVVENDRGCRVDGFCVLSVRAADGLLARVIYGTPRGVPCVNAAALARAQELESGAEVRVRARVADGGDLDACADAEGSIEPVLSSEPAGGRGVKP